MQLGDEVLNVFREKFNAERYHGFVRGFIRIKRDDAQWDFGLWVGPTVPGQ
jgi:hypothetical protein